MNSHPRISCDYYTYTSTKWTFIRGPGTAVLVIRRFLWIKPKVANKHEN